MFAALPGVLAACGAAGAPGSSPDASPAPGASPGGAIVRVNRPFDSVLNLADDKGRAVYDATQRAIAACMKDEGFNFTPRPFATDPAREDRRGDVDYARTEGYGLASGKARGDRPPDGQDTDDVQGLSPSEAVAWSEALLGKQPVADISGPMRSEGTFVVVDAGDGSQYGFDSASCASRGAAKVHGDDVEYQRLRVTVEAISNEGIRRVDEDTAVKSAVTQWRSCMVERGHDYPKPGGSVANELAAELAEAKADLDAVRKAEIEVAVADAECFNEHGLAAVYNDATKRVEAQLSEKNQNIIVRFAELQTQAADRAKDGTAAS